MEVKTTREGAKGNRNPDGGGGGCGVDGSRA